MEAINQLEHSYFLLKSGGGDFRDCVEWACDRLRYNEECDDTDIVLLAASEARSEALTFAEQVIERYSGYQALDAQLAAGKYLVSLRHDYQRGLESTRSLESKLVALYERLGFPRWLAVLVRTCRYARAGREQLDCFEKEFAYLARLWALAHTCLQFEARYNPSISARHDLL